MDTFFIIFVALFGLIIGSFLNCLIWRLYKNESLGGRSYCPHCRQMIAWYDNIPLLSFFILGGRCRHCHQKISWQYPLVELMTAVLFVIMWQIDINDPQATWLILRDWLLIITLLIVFVYDWRWQMVPMSIVWPMSAVIFSINLLLGFSWSTLLLASALAAAFFLVQYIATKQRGIGEGDIWLGAFLGLAFPSAGKLLTIMVLSYGLGSIVGLSLMAGQKKAWKSQIALGPFLATGAIITLIWGRYLINWYLKSW